MWEALVPNRFDQTMGKAHRSTSLNQTLKGGNYWEGLLIVYIKVGSPLWKKVRESTFVIVRIIVL